VSLFPKISFFITRSRSLQEGLGDFCRRSDRLLRNILLSEGHFYGFFAVVPMRPPARSSLDLALQQIPPSHEVGGLER